MTSHPTACLALADGTYFLGVGFGATGQTEAELCFNTAMTGYQEIMTDPSYAGQVVTFTFPHVGNVGVNPDDDETGDPVAAGMVVKWMPTEPSNWRAAQPRSDWLAARGRIAIGGQYREPTLVLFSGRVNSACAWSSQSTRLRRRTACVTGRERCAIR